MAIYHLSASIVKRSAGRSVTAAAAYRAGSKIEDLTTGLVHDYTRKQGIDHSEILSPISASLGNEWLLDREKLWNKIEEIEKRKDGQLAREITIAIPTELDRASQIELVREYVRVNFVNLGMIADINIHHLDGNNPHAHVLLTMRNLQTNSKGDVEFGLKNTDWNSKNLLLAQRKSWEQITNKYLTAAGSEAKIDCRSLAEQGSPYIPQIHMGVHATAMKRKGISTDRSDQFDRIEAENNDIRARLEEIYQQEYTEPELELNEADNERKEKDHRLAELIIEAMKHNPYPRSEREADRAKQGLRRDHTWFDSSHLKLHYSVVLKTKKNIESIEITIGGARPRLFTFEKESNRWIKKTFYHKTAFPEIFYPNPFLKDQIDYAVANFNENTIDRYYHKLQKVKLEDEQLQLKENKLGKLIIDLSEKLQSKSFYVEPYDIYVGKDNISIGKRSFSLYSLSSFELKSDSQGNYAREYIQSDRDNESTINYFTEIVTNYQNELREKIESEILPKVIKSSVRSGDVLEHIRSLQERVVMKEQEKLVNVSQIAEPIPVEIIVRTPELIQAEAQVEKESSLVQKTDRESESKICEEPSIPSNLTKHELLLLRLQQQNRKNAEKYLTKRTEQPKSQAKRKPSRGFER